MGRLTLAAALGWWPAFATAAGRSAVFGPPSPVARYSAWRFHSRAVGILPPPGDPARGRRSVYKSVVRIRAALDDVGAPPTPDWAGLPLLLDPTPRDNLVSALHGESLRLELYRSMRAGGYPLDYSPATTWDLVARSHSGGCRPGLRETDTTSGGVYHLHDDSIEVNAAYGDPGEYDPALVLAHELGHASQHPSGIVAADRDGAAYIAYVRHSQLADPRHDALEIPQGLSDLCLMGEAYRLHAGAPLDVRLKIAAGYRPDLRWMVERARAHGLFSGRPGTTMTELLASPAGLRWLRLLLERSISPPSAPLVGPA